MNQGLEWLAFQQHKLGHWTAQGRYPTAMTSLAGMAFLCEGSTTTQGKYADNVRRAVDFLTRRSRANGLIGDIDDERYTYGHGFAMLFLSQVLGEEEDLDRRLELVEVLAKAVKFTGQAQTRRPAAGATSAQKMAAVSTKARPRSRRCKGCAGVATRGFRFPKRSSDNAVGYIHKCTNKKDGGVQYSSKGGGSRPAITAAAVACLYNAGEYDDTYVPRMLEYCRAQLKPNSRDSFGHWHYAHFYYAQVMYREGDDEWMEYIDAIQKRTATRGGTSADGRCRLGGLETRLYRAGVHDGRELDCAAARQCLPANLSTLNEAILNE